MAYVVNTQPLVRRYRAGLCSGACCLCILTVIGTVLLPLFFGLAAEGFWTKEVIRFEQPDVTFTNDLVVFATGRTVLQSGASSPLSVGYSTVPRINALLGSAVRAPTMQSALLSTTGDARVDSAAWNISIPLGASETITSVSVVIPCNVKLHDTVRLDTSSAFVIAAGPGNAGRAATVIADARLNMRMQLPAGTRYLDPSASALAVDLAGATSLASVRPEAVALRLLERNITLDVVPSLSRWEPDDAFTPRASGSTAGTATGGFEALASGRTFDLQISVRVTPQPVWMRPTLSETLKLAWVQYLALLVPIFVAFWALNCLVLDSGIVDASADADRVVKAKLH